MPHYPLLVAALLILNLVSPAAAASFYIFGDVGITDSDVGVGGLNRANGNESGYTLGAGYELNRTVSLQAAYHDFGTHDGETDCPSGFACLIVPLSADADVTGISLALTGRVPLTDRWDGYAKLGLMRSDVEFGGISAAFDDSSGDLLIGLGLSWSVDEHWKVFAEYTKVDLELDTASVGLRYSF